LITEEYAQELMMTLISLKTKAASGEKKCILEFRKHERVCLNNFRYLIHMTTCKYKGFPNYEDLN